MEKVNYTIYGIVCPIEKRVIYVGRTVLPLAKRLNTHIKYPTGKKMKQWVEYIDKRGKLGEIEMLPLVTNVLKNDSIIIERQHILHYHSLGGVLNGNSTGEKSTWDRMGNVKSRGCKTTLFFYKDTLLKISAKAKKAGIKPNLLMQRIVEQWVNDNK